ncbi:MAG: hypothetical protein RMJ04_02325 [Geminicoccaceae bacterium]|nr:hypothetical protein [Geminicoccaceae bacterium]
MFDPLSLPPPVPARPAAEGFLLLLPAPSPPFGPRCARLHAAGVRALVSLLPRSEARALGIDLAALARACAALGIAWWHAPIPDFAAPDAAFERRWRTRAPLLRDLLRARAGVALHCRAGLGRSGTIAARLLVELGIAPEEAIARVRASRPGAIETAAQEAHVLARARLRPARDAGREGAERGREEASQAGEEKKRPRGADRWRRP